MRKSTITISAVGCFVIIYFLGYFALVKRFESEQVEIVNRAGSAPPKPGDLVEVTTVRPVPLYVCAPEALFWPVHYLDSRVFRPQYWADRHTEKPVRVNH
jgi:hypothetical protein